MQKTPPAQTNFTAAHDKLSPRRLPRGAYPAVRQGCHALQLGGQHEAQFYIHSPEFLLFSRQYHFYRIRATIERMLRWIAV
jgi:hypothetical protein